jgi:hypothetical protein
MEALGSVRTSSENEAAQTRFGGGRQDVTEVLPSRIEASSFVEPRSKRVCFQ